MKSGLLLAGLRINLKQKRAPLAGFITPCVAVWDRSGSIYTSVSEPAVHVQTLEFFESDLFSSRKYKMSSKF